MKFLIASILSSIFASLLSQLVYFSVYDIKKIRSYIEKSKDRMVKLLKKKNLKSEEKEELINLQIKLSYINLAINVISSLPLFAFYFVIKEYFKESKPFVILPFSLPIIGNDIGWFITYLFFFSIFSSIFRKIFMKKLKIKKL